MRFATREAWWLGACLIGLALAVLPGPAWGGDPYQVTGISIDATAESATVARERALVDGQRRALERLLDRLVDPADRARIALPDPGITATWVASFEVADERRSSVRYLARLTVTFADQVLRDFLRQSGVAFADTPSPPILVLPVLRQEGQAYFGGINPWLAAWQAGTREGLAQFVLPGEPAHPDDAMPPALVLAADDALLEAVAERYGVGDVLVAEFTEGVAGASLRGSWIGSAGRGRVLVEAVPEGLATPVERYHAAVNALVKWVEDAWRRDNLVRPGEAGVFESTVPLESLADWVAVRQGLGRITAIHEITLLSFSRREARILIRHSGAPEGLAGAMGAQGLALARMADAWEIRVVSSGPAPGGPR